MPKPQVCQLGRMLRCLQPEKRACSSYPRRRTDFKGAGDLSAVEELRNVGLFRQDAHSGLLEIAGSSVLERLFPNEEFDIDVET